MELYLTIAQSVRAVENQLAVPRHRARVRRRRALEMLGACSLFMALVAQIWVRLLMIEAAYEIEQLRAIALERDTELRQLRLEYSRLTAPARLVARAESRLGMRERTPDQVQTIGTVGNTEVAR